MTLETQTESALSDYVKKFLLEFKDEKGNFRYVDDIDTMMPSKLKFINVDYNDLVLHPDIESVFHENPDSILEAFSRAIKEILQERFPKYAKKIEHEVRARIANYPVQRSLRQINAEVIGKITSVSGMVLRASEVKPLAKELVFVCPEGHRTDVLLGHGLTLTSPVQCSNPKCNHRELGVEPESSRFIDVQFVRLQELPEDLPPGQLPHYLDVTVKQDLVDNARPGDRVVLTGVVRIEQEKMSGVSKNSSPLYRLRLDGNNVEFLGGGKKDKKSRKIQREEISTEDEKMIKSLSKSPDLYQQLIDSYAPHITGHEVVKESILLLMAGSTQRELQDGSKIRGDINIFLVGDPGTAKSEMLKFCVRVAPRGLYTCGRGSTTQRR